MTFWTIGNAVLKAWRRPARPRRSLDVTKGTATSSRPMLPYVLMQQAVCNNLALCDRAQAGKRRTLVPAAKNAIAGPFARSVPLAGRLLGELAESGDLSHINVASLTERAGLTRRHVAGTIPTYQSNREHLLAEIRGALSSSPQLAADLYRKTSMPSRHPVRLSCSAILRLMANLSGPCWARAATL